MATLFARAGAQTKPPPMGQCDPKAMMQDVYHDQLDRALAESELCRAYHGSQDQSGPWASFHAISVAYYEAAGAQILTMMGSLDSAETLWLSADSIATYQHNWLVDWASVRARTEGLLREARGDEAGAIRIYSVADLNGRLAVLALRRGDDVEARYRARLGALAHDADAYLVLASLAELDANPAAATVWYSYAQQVMEESFSRIGDLPSTTPPPDHFSRAPTDPTIPTPRDGHNNFQPASLAERRRVRDGRLRLGATVALPARSGAAAKFYDERGQLVGWEKWPHVLYSAAVEDKQQSYNDWVAGQKEAQLAVEWIGQYPRGMWLPPDRSNLGDLISKLAPSTAGAAIRMPDRIEPTGVLDLDTLAIPYYQTLARWAQMTRDAGLSATELFEPLAEEEAGTASEKAPSENPPKQDEVKLLKWELKQAAGVLLAWEHLLQGVPLKTSAGLDLDGWKELFVYEANRMELSKLRSSSLAASRGLAELNPPPDFMTAHIEPETLTPELIERLRTLQREAQARLFIARQLSH